MQLTGNLLVVVVHGQLILRRDGSTRVVHAGEGCLISTGSLVVTEVPPTAVGSAEIFYFFFDDKVVRQRFSDLAKVERLALGMAPAPTALFRLPNFVAQTVPILAEGGFRFPQDFTRVLNIVFHHGWSRAWMFLKAFFARRRALHLHLEKYVFPIVPGKTVVDAYPEGPRQFGQDFRAQYDVPLVRWLTWRRLEVARIKIRYEKRMSLEQIAVAAGYQNFHRFRHQYRYHFQTWPEEEWRTKDRAELSPAELTQALTPFWHWSFPYALFTREAACAFITRAHVRQYPRRIRKRLWAEELSRRCEVAAIAPSTDDRFLTCAGAEDDVPTNILPFDSSGFEEFIELEASLNPADLLQPLAA